MNSLCNDCKNTSCPMQSGIKRTECAFYIPTNKSGYVRLETVLDLTDLRPVVLCRDCIHAPLPGDCEGGSNMEWPKIDGIYEDCTCPHFCDDDWYSTRPDPDGFCEKGERRESNLDTTKGDNHD